jgi:hypothetical protein
MNNYKVGQRVKVISGANVTPSEQFNGMEGVITDITRNNTPDVMIYVDFENGYKIWCYTQNDRGIELNIEVIEDTPPTPKWLPIDKDNLPDEPVLAGNIDKKQIVVNRITINHLDNTIQSHNRREFFEVTHYISLSDLLNLPIAE